MSEDLYKAKERLLADLARAKEDLRKASPHYERQANAMVVGTEMLLEALERKMPKEAQASPPNPADQ